MSKVRLSWYPAAFLSEVDRTINRRLYQASEEYEQLVQASFGQAGKPKVVSGKLKESIKSGKVRKNKYRVGTNVDYSRYLEYGTSRIHKLPFFRPTFYTYFSRFKRLFSGKF